MLGSKTCFGIWVLVSLCLYSIDLGVNKSLRECMWQSSRAAVDGDGEWEEKVCIEVRYIET